VLSEAFFRHVHAEDRVTGPGWSITAICSLPGVCVGGQGEDPSVKDTHTHTHTSRMGDSHTSAEPRDVTSIRFSARKANTAAARTGGGFGEHTLWRSDGRDEALGGGGLK